jgi:hypothetical protein
VWQRIEVNLLRKNALCAALVAVVLALIHTPHLAAQETPSKTTSSVASESTTSTSPSSALRDLLSAACSQSQNEFTRLLTARNKEAFSRMAPSARVALMKRFVLLSEPGKPTSSTDVSGRPTVHCETPAVTTEMQIGGADVRDNVAFLPLELRDTKDVTGTTVHQATVGLVRENGEWKLLSLGVLLLDLPALELEWDAAEMENNERSAIDSLKKIVDAIESYRHTYTRLPQSLANLGPPLHGAATGEAAGLVDSELATEMKGGYSFRYVIVGGSSAGSEAKFEVAAKPSSYGRTGLRSFLRDSNGVFHGADHQGAVGSILDPEIK